VEHEIVEYKLALSVRERDVEVYIRRELVGWFEVEKSKEEGVMVTYICERERKKKRIGAVYIRPGKELERVKKGLGGIEECDIIIGD